MHTKEKTKICVLFGVVKVLTFKIGEEQNDKSAHRKILNNDKYFKHVLLGTTWYSLCRGLVAQQLNHHLTRMLPRGCPPPASHPSGVSASKPAPCRPGRKPLDASASVWAPHPRRGPPWSSAPGLGQPFVGVNQKAEGSSLPLSLTLSSFLTLK